MSILMQEAILSFLISLPFLLIANYFVRLAVSVAAQLVLWWLIILGMSHHGAHWDIARVLPCILAAIAAAHVRVVWEFARRLIRT